MPPVQHQPAPRCPRQGHPSGAQASGNPCNPACNNCRLQGPARGADAVPTARSIHADIWHAACSSTGVPSRDRVRRLLTGIGWACFLLVTRWLGWLQIHTPVDRENLALKAPHTADAAAREMLATGFGLQPGGSAEREALFAAVDADARALGLDRVVCGDAMVLPALLLRPRATARRTAPAGHHLPRHRPCHATATS